MIQKQTKYVFGGHFGMYYFQTFTQNRNDWFKLKLLSPIITYSNLLLIVLNVNTGNISPKGSITRAQRLKLQNKRSINRQLHVDPRDGQKAEKQKGKALAKTD